jgi:hypothetical protein
MLNFIGQTELFPKTITFFKKKMKNFDMSKLNHIHLSIGRTYDGSCYYPTKTSKNYKIECRLSKSDPLPETIDFYVRPKVIIKGLRKTIKSRTDKEVANNHEEWMIWLLGHELFHFLRDTRQIGGKNTQSQANEYGFALLREFKRT